MTVNGTKVTEGQLPKTIPLQISLGEGMDIGEDIGSAAHRTMVSTHEIVDEDVEFRITREPGGERRSFRGGTLGRHSTTPAPAERPRQLTVATSGN